MPVSIFILIHNIIIPRVAGIAINKEIMEKLYFSIILKIILVIPTENNSENK